jgi:flavorubredoxin
MTSMEAEINPLPRELAPGVYWLGNCGESRYRDFVLHSYDSVYLVAGEESSAIIEAGDPKNLPFIEAQVDQLVSTGIPEIKSIFLTHQETPHASGAGRFLQHFPDALAYGNVNDYHMAFPQYADRFVELEIGSSINIGGTEIDVLEAVFRDYIYTRWFFDRRSQVLFSGDGFAYSHYHAAGQCGKVAEECPELALPEMTAVYSERAFFWTQFVDIEPYIDRLEWLLDRIGAKILAPTHGLPIVDVEGTLPKLMEGLRLGSSIGLGGTLGLTGIGFRSGEGS